MFQLRDHLEIWYWLRVKEIACGTLFKQLFYENIIDKINIQFTINKTKPIQYYLSSPYQVIQRHKEKPKRELKVTYNCSGCFEIFFKGVCSQQRTNQSRKEY